MVQGKICDTFVVNCLELFFNQKIETVSNIIEKFDKVVENSLTNKKTTAPNQIINKHRS